MRVISTWTPFVAAGFAVALAAAPAHAQLNNVFTFRNLTNVQSGAGGSVLTPDSPFFNAGVSMANPGDFDSVTLTSPNGTEPLAPTSPTSFGIGPSFPDQAAMDAAYPFGDYVFTATNSVTSAAQTETLHYTADAYAGDTPALDGASFDALQGLHTSHGLLTIDFNAQSPSPLATSSFTFFTIFGSNQGCGFLSPSAASCVIDPHALARGQTYTYELDFSDRVESSPNGTLNGVDFDVRTDGSFTTSAVPEPAAWAIMLIGLAAIGSVVRTRRRSFAAT
jgi:hypothetical protein